MVQTGVMTRLAVEWEGPGLPKHEAQPLEVSYQSNTEVNFKNIYILLQILSLGQTLVVFILIGSALAASVLLLLVEFLFKRYRLYRFKGLLSGCTKRFKKDYFVMDTAVTVQMVGGGGGGSVKISTSAKGDKKIIE